METMTWVYFFYMFVSIYFLLITIIVYLKNKKNLFISPTLTKNYPLSVLIPAYNEEDTLQDTVEHVLKTNYLGLKEVIIINDGSKDKTLEIARKLEKKYGLIRVLDKKNSGKADSLNQALKIAKGELIAIVDADSFPEKNAFSNVIGFFDDPLVGAATSACTPRNRNKFLEKMQTIEYKVIALTRKLLEYLDSIYVAPGSLSIYRKKALQEAGGFDITNITEDIESTWHLIDSGWKIRMSLDSRVTTKVPNKIKPWFRQRVRWSVGGLQVLNKYKNRIFQKGMFGLFIIPFFSFGLLLSLLGIIIFFNMIFKRIFYSFLVTNYSFVARTNLIEISSFVGPMSILNYLGMVLFFFFFLFTVFVLAIMKDNIGEKQSFFNLVFYMTLYLITYSIVTITGIISYFRGKTKWR